MRGVLLVLLWLVLISGCATRIVASVPPPDASAAGGAGRAP